MTVDTIIIKTDSHKTKALVAFLTVFDVCYALLPTVMDNNNGGEKYNPQFVSDILQSKEDKKNGKGTKMAIEDLEMLWNIPIQSEKSVSITTKIWQ